MALFFEIYPIVFIYLTKFFRSMETQAAIVLFALVAVFGLVTVVAVDIILTAQEAESAGCSTSVSVNASKGRCIKG